MEVIYLLIGVSVMVALIFLGAFIWAIKTDQFSDTETPSIRMLFDDNSNSASTKNRK